MLIRFQGPMGTYKAFPAATIINSWALIEEGKKPQISPGEFAGKIVLIGGSAPGIKDLRPSLFNPDCPGVEIHAAALDTLIQGDFMRPSSGFVLYALGLIFAIITGIATSVQRKIWRIVLFFLICLALPAASSILAFLSGYWLEFVAPELAVVFSFIGASLINYSVEGKQRRFIKNIFRFYLSPDVIERMLKNPGLLKLGGEKREVSSFFSDVAGFTSISEGLSPEELVNLLNSYLSEMTNIILSSGGTLDKYEGDAIIAFWNAPLDQPDHALRACRAAMHCQRRLEEVRSDFQSRFGHEIRMRIGVNSGPAVVGNMGSAKRFDYTAMGDTINLASRLEGACKQYGVPILIGELTYEKVKDEIFCREVDLIRVIGKKKPVRVFEAIAERSELSPAEEERIKSFHSGLEAYRHQDWAKALSVFQSLPDDRLVQTYITRISNFQSSSPPESWDGVYELKHK
jgi:adenylate cyclase